MRNFIREKRVTCGSRYMEVDIIPRCRTQEISVKGKRSKKKKESLPKQKNLNDKNAKRYFVQLVQGNFGEGDIHISLTYDNKNLPGTIEEAEKVAYKYIRRVDYRMKKEGVGPLRYILVTEAKYSKENNIKPVRIHHHLIINSGLDRDTLEDLWSVKKKGIRKREKIGYVNADRLQVDESGLEAISKYLMKDPGGKKRWSSSRNLERPYSRTNDFKYSRRQVERIVKEPLDKQFWEKQYKGYKLTSYKPVYNDDTGWSIYLKMWKEDS